MADQNSFNFRLGKVNQDVKYHGSSGPLRIHELVEGQHAQNLPGALCTVKSSDAQKGPSNQRGMHLSSRVVLSTKKRCRTRVMVMHRGRCEVVKQSTHTHQAIGGASGYKLMLACINLGAVFFFSQFWGVANKKGYEGRGRESTEIPCKFMQIRTSAGMTNWMTNLANGLDCQISWKQKIELVAKPWLALLQSR